MLHLAMRAGAMGRRATAGPVARPWAEQAKRRSLQIARPLREAKKGDGISVDVEYSGLWGAITTFPKRRPFMTNIIVATVKTSFADFLVQKAEGKEWKDIDWKRNGVFTAFGFAYLGCAQWFVYVTAFARLCPNAIRFANMSWADKMKFRAGQIDLVKQVALDNFVHYPLMYFPVFYFFKELIQADSSLTQVGQDALSRYWKNSVTDNLYIWALWIPGDLVVYACPIWMRLPLNHAISAAWTMILSAVRGNEK